MQKEITPTLMRVLAIGLLLSAPGLNAQADRSTRKAPAANVQNAAQLDLLYQQGLAAIEQQDWMQALIKLERVQVLQPNYLQTANLIAAARANLLKQAKASDSNLSLSLNGVLFGVGGFALLGIVLWLPTYRARLYRLLGKHTRAALIYERLVARKPSRMKLYPPLAEAYLRLDRRDATAIRIYKRVLELNLPTSLRAELHNIVTGYNLDEVQTRWHVKEVVDSRLEKNLTKRLAEFRSPQQAPAATSKPSSSPRRPRKPAKGKGVLADYGYAGNLAMNGKIKIEKY